MTSVRKLQAALKASHLGADNARESLQRCSAKLLEAEKRIKFLEGRFSAYQKHSLKSRDALEAASRLIEAVCGFVGEIP